MADVPRVTRWRQRNRDAGKEALTIWLDAGDKAKLLAMAQQQHMSPSALLVAALKAYQPVPPPGTPVTDTSQLWALMQELLIVHLPGIVRELMQEQSTVAETVAEAVQQQNVADAVTEIVQGRDSDVTETPAHPDLAEEVLEMLTGVTYDATRYKLGKLCRRGHSYEGTGQSLLYRRNSVCVACDRERVTERRAAKRKG
jgi:hypothetical protein